MASAPSPVSRIAGSGCCNACPFKRLGVAAWRRLPAVAGLATSAVGGELSRRAALRPARIRRAGGLLFGLFLSGCATPNGLPNALSLFGGADPPEKATANAEPATCATPQACAAELKKLVSDPRRDWIGRPQSADAYASGTRLFAYRALRKKLSCRELKGAFEDASAAATLMQSPRHDQARALTTTVAHELKIERDRRCRPRG
jgi:hypothetical protein